MGQVRTFSPWYYNFGHGKQNLAMMFAALNMLAFAIHTVCDCLERIWTEASVAKRARKRFFEHVRTIPAYLVFPDWNTLMQTLIDLKPPREIKAQIARRTKAQTLFRSAGAAPRR